ncbi:hypothetical protein ABKN59_001707 [Abortiporus biennis]
MGQYWEVVNFDKRQTLRCVCKLGEALFDGSFDNVGYHFWPFELLSKTPTPEVYVIDKDCDPVMKHSHGSKSRSYGLERIDRSRWKKEYIFSPLSRRTLGDLARLPNEIILEILEQTVDDVDVIHFSLTNTNIYFPGYKVLQRRYLKVATDWEGDRIVCLGHYTQWEDIAPKLFTKAELENICSDGGIEYQLQDSNTADNNGTLNGQDTHIPEALFDALRMSKWSRPRDYVYDTFEDARELHGLSPKSTRREVEAHSQYEPEVVLLCNLSKRVYINILQILNLEGRGLTWTAFLATKICWSSDSSCSMAYQGEDLHYGEWAGDRFACRRMDQLEELGCEGEWKDVTEQEVKRIREIWIMDLGCYWQESSGWGNRY